MKDERLPELKAELLLSHEITGPYSADDPTAALEITAMNIPYYRQNVSGSQLFALTDPDEFDGLTDAQRADWMRLCAIDTHQLPVNGTVHKTVERVFPNPGVTRSALIDWRVTDDNGQPIMTSRQAQLKWGIIHGGDCEKARTWP